MNEEVKEIIDKLNEYKDYDDYVDYTGSYFNPLLDYITNLEKKYEEADNDRHELFERNEKAIEYINKYEYQKYCPGPYEKDKYIMREEKEGQDLLNILRGDE